MNIQQDETGYGFEQVGPDRIQFVEPPRLQSSRVEIIVTNGDDVGRHFVEVLPHDPEATRIPIRLIK